MTTEDSTENMPEPLVKEVTLYIAHNFKYLTHRKSAIDIINIISRYSQAELDRRVAEAEERQLVKSISGLGMWRRYADLTEHELHHVKLIDKIIIACRDAILNAGGKGDE